VPGKFRALCLPPVDIDNIHQLIAVTPYLAALVMFPREKFEEFPHLPVGAEGEDPVGEDFLPE